MHNVTANLTLYTRTINGELVAQAKSTSLAALKLEDLEWFTDQCEGIPCWSGFALSSTDEPEAQVRFDDFAGFVEQVAKQVVFDDAGLLRPWSVAAGGLCEIMGDYRTSLTEARVVLAMSAHYTIEGTFSDRVNEAHKGIAEALKGRWYDAQAKGVETGERVARPGDYFSSEELVEALRVRGLSPGHEEALRDALARIIG